MKNNLTIKESVLLASLDQDSQLMQPLEEEWSVCAPKPLLPQSCLPLPGLRAE